jgi:carboxymethylenebutenolidase
MQRSLDQSKLRQDMLNSARYLKSAQLSNGKLGATGFCWGGGVANMLAVQMGADLHASVPFYGAAAKAEDVPKIRAALLIHYAENDPRINGMRDGYEAALKEHNVRYEMHSYPGTRHGFHNNSTPRFNEAQAKIAWQRTVAHFKRYLA